MSRGSFTEFVARIEAEMSDEEREQLDAYRRFYEQEARRLKGDDGEEGVGVEHGK